MDNGHPLSPISIVDWWQQTGGDWANLAIVISAVFAIALYLQARHQKLVAETLKYISLPERDESLREARRILIDNYEAIGNTGFYELPAEIRDAIVLIANHFDICGFLGRKKLILLEDYLEVTMLVIVERWRQASPHIKVMRERFQNPILLSDFEWLASEAEIRVSKYKEGQ